MILLEKDPFWQFFHADLWIQISQIPTLSTKAELLTPNGDSDITRWLASSMVSGCKHNTGVLKWNGNGNQSGSFHFKVKVNRTAATKHNDPERWIWAQLNPHSPSGPVHPYQLDESISHFRGVWCPFSFLFHFQYIFLLTNSEEPDQMPRSVA